MFYKRDDRRFTTAWLPNQGNYLLFLINVEFNILEHFDVFGFGVGEFYTLKFKFTLDLSNWSCSARFSYWHVDVFFDSVGGSVNLETGSNIQAELHNVASRCQEQKQESNQLSRWKTPLWVRWQSAAVEGNADQSAVKERVADELENSRPKGTTLANEHHSLVNFSEFCDFALFTVEGFDSAHVSEDFFTDLGKFSFLLLVHVIELRGFSSQNSWS